MSHSVPISPMVLVGFLGLTSSFFEGPSFCNALARLVRTTSVKFIGLFPHYMTERLPLIFPLTEANLFSRGLRFLGGLLSLLSRHPTMTVKTVE